MLHLFDTSVPMNMDLKIPMRSLGVLGVSLDGVSTSVVSLGSDFVIDNIGTSS